MENRFESGLASLGLTGGRPEGRTERAISRLPNHLESWYHGWVFANKTCEDKCEVHTHHSDKHDKSVTSRENLWCLTVAPNPNRRVHQWKSAAEPHPGRVLHQDPGKESQTTLDRSSVLLFDFLEQEPIHHPRATHRGTLGAQGPHLLRPGLWLDQSWVSHSDNASLHTATLTLLKHSQ